MSDQPSAKNLTGIWQGLYTYPYEYDAVPFGATLIETPGWLTGSTQEICSIGPDTGALLCATLEGHRLDQTVSFIKTYDGSADNYRTVHYQGTITADGNEIEGIWRVTPRWRGRFLMVRSGSAEIEEKREAFQKAS